MHRGRVIKGLVAAALLSAFAIGLLLYYFPTDPTEDMITTLSRLPLPYVAGALGVLAIAWIADSLRIQTRERVGT